MLKRKSPKVTFYFEIPMLMNKELTFPSRWRRSIQSFIFIDYMRKKGKKKKKKTSGREKKNSTERRMDDALTLKMKIYIYNQ